MHSAYLAFLVSVRKHYAAGSVSLCFTKSVQHKRTESLLKRALLQPQPQKWVKNFSVHSVHRWLKNLFVCRNFYKWCI